MYYLAVEIVVDYPAEDIGGFLAEGTVEDCLVVDIDDFPEVETEEDYLAEDTAGCDYHFVDVEDNYHVSG